MRIARTRNFSNQSLITKPRKALFEYEFYITRNHKRSSALFHLIITTVFIFSQVPHCTSTICFFWNTSILKLTHFLHDFFYTPSAATTAKGTDEILQSRPFVPRKRMTVSELAESMKRMSQREEEGESWEWW